MCITAPGQVVAVDRDGAVVQTAGRRRRASTAVLPGIGVGDWVIVGAGTILRRLEPATARELIQTIDEARALAESRADPTGGQR